MGPQGPGLREPRVAPQLRALVSIPWHPQPEWVPGRIRGALQSLGHLRQPASQEWGPSPAPSSQAAALPSRQQMGPLCPLQGPPIQRDRPRAGTVETPRPPPPPPRPTCPAQPSPPAAPSPQRRVPRQEEQELWCRAVLPTWIKAFTRSRPASVPIIPPPPTQTKPVDPFLRQSSPGPCSQEGLLSREAGIFQAGSTGIGALFHQACRSSPVPTLPRPPCPNNPAPAWSQRGDGGEAHLLTSRPHRRALQPPQQPAPPASHRPPLLRTSA